MALRTASTAGVTRFRAARKMDCIGAGGHLAQQAMLAPFHSRGGAFF